MQAGQLISNIISPLKCSDQIQKALEVMTEFKVSHLPLVENKQFLGLVSEEEIAGVKDQFLRFKEASINLLNTFIAIDAHLLDVLKVMAQHRLSVLPVLGLDKTFKGLIFKSNLLEELTRQMSLDVTGAIIVLNIHNKDLSLSQITQIVESNNVKLIFMYVTPHTDSTQLDVTLKVNVTDVALLKTAFERYQYQIKAIFNHYDLDDQMIVRYEALMNYLSV